MTVEEYRERLAALRKEHADAIREAAMSQKEDFNLMHIAGIQWHEYQSRVNALIEEYHS